MIKGMLNDNNLKFVVFVIVLMCRNPKQRELNVFSVKMKVFEH